MKKKQNKQNAQNDKKSKIKITKIEKCGRKLSTCEILKKWKKTSYTPSYKHYPRKKREKTRFT